MKAPEDCCHVVKLSHILSAPIAPPKVDVDDSEAFDSAVDALHAQCTEVMTGLLQNDSTDEDSR